MTNWLLFARARSAIPVLVGLLVVDGVGALLHSSMLVLPFGSGFSVPWVSVLPALAASIIGMGVRSTMHDLEGTAARRMPGLRGVHLAVMLVFTAAGTVAYSAGLSGTAQWAAALRNLAILTGLALLCGCVLGGRLSWILPLGYTMTALTLGTDSHNRVRDWALILQPDHHRVAAVIAVALLAVGAGTVCLAGTRESADEQE